MRYRTSSILRLGLLALGLLCFVGAKHWLESPALHWGFLFLLIAVLGVPHGALDHHVGQSWLKPRQGSRWWLSFGVFYLGLLLIVLLSWLWQPELLLSLFLLLSALHFGQEDSAPLALTDRLYWTHVAFRGLLPLCAPAFFSTEATAQLLAPLLLDRELAPQAQGIASFGAILFAPLSLLGVLIYARWWQLGVSRATLSQQLLETILIVLCFALLAPLEGFVLYFCLHHALRHTQEMAHWLFPEQKQPLRHFWQRAKPLSLVAVGLAGLCWLLLPDRSLGWGGIQIIFIGLAALTLPHVVLHWFVFDLMRPLPLVSPPLGEVS